MALVTVRFVDSFQVIPSTEVRQIEIIHGNEVRWWLTGCGDGPFSMTFEGADSDDEDVSDVIALQFFEDVISAGLSLGAPIIRWEKHRKEDSWRRDGVVIGERSDS